MSIPASISRLDFSSTPELLRVTIRPTRPWLAIPLQVGGLLLAMGIFYYFVFATELSWPEDAAVLYAGIGIAFVVVLQTIVQFLGAEMIEINADTITVRKMFFGWEHKREYAVKDCSELEWKEGSDFLAHILGGLAFLFPGRLLPGFKCKVGKRTVTLSKNLSEHDVNRILAALQQALPVVSQQLNAYPLDGEKFTTLKLS